MLFSLLNAKKGFSTWPKYNQEHETGKREKQLQRLSGPLLRGQVQALHQLNYHPDVNATAKSGLSKPEIKSLSEKVQHFYAEDAYLWEGRTCQGSLKLKDGFEQFPAIFLMWIKQIVLAFLTADKTQKEQFCSYCSQFYIFHNHEISKNCHKWYRHYIQLNCILTELFFFFSEIMRAKKYRNR